MDPVFKLIPFGDGLEARRRRLAEAREARDRLEAAQGLGVKPSTLTHLEDLGAADKVRLQEGRKNSMPEPEPPDRAWQWGRMPESFFPPEKLRLANLGGWPALIEAWLTAPAGLEAADPEELDFSGAEVE